MYERVSQRLQRWRSFRFSRRPVELRLDHPLVSFTFDDFPASALHVGGAILEKHGFTGTYYVSLGLADKVGPVGKFFSESDLPGLLDRGHELGCHTFHHRNAWETGAAEYHDSVLKNRERLAQILPGVEFASHAYPIWCPHPANKAIVARYFQCARGTELSLNGRTVDANSLNAIFIEKAYGDFSVVKAQIDRTVATGAWLILATHDVCDNPTPFGCSTAIFSSIVSYIKQVGLPVVPVARAFANLRGNAEA